MRLGRDFTNFLYLDYLSEEDKRRLEAGELSVGDVNALVGLAAKADIPRQIEVAKSLGLNHVELDGAVPNPFLGLSDGQKAQAREVASSKGITLSLHLPYTYAGSALCSPSPHERREALELLNSYLSFASEVNCRYAVLHPGLVPPYHVAEAYLRQVRGWLESALAELAIRASELGIKLHLENNTAFDLILYELPELLELVERVRERGAELYFCFDLGHWFTRADAGGEIPNPPERVLEEIPKGMTLELHLNDYVVGRREFHPPLHEGRGLLKRSNLKRFSRLAVELGAELVVVETALRTREEIMKRWEILEAETRFLKELFG